MFERTQTLIFATRDSEKARSFYDSVLQSKAEDNPAAFFNLYAKREREPFVLESISQLLKILEKFKPSRMNNTLLILDYQSLQDYFHLRDEEEKFSALAELFLTYPEIRIWILRDNHKTHPIFGCPDEPKYVRYEFLCKTFDELSAFGIDLRGTIQLFDPSGIRNYLKKQLIRHIEFFRDNFYELHQSREAHFAISVDEEIRHAFFWGYSLYNFGYSALPIITSKELNALKFSDNAADSQNTIKLICRDYDLQFSDLNTQKKKEKDRLYHYRGVMPASQEDDTVETKRGWILKREFWSKFFTKKEGFTNKLDETSTWIISQVPLVKSTKDEKDDVDIAIAGSKVRKLLARKLPPEVYKDFEKYGITFFDNRVYLRGQSKEISGIMALLDAEEIEKVFLKSRDYSMVTCKRGAISHHAIPAVNSRIAESILRRSKRAYKEGKYLIAALLASEALEILNGLSLSLSLGALFLKTVAEAQMELNVVGIGSFKKVIKKRIYEIRRQIKRICGENHRAERNARMQIFNKLRHIFEENQQFDTAEKLYEEVLKAEFYLEDIHEIQLKDKVTGKQRKPKCSYTRKQKITNTCKYVFSAIFNNFYFRFMLLFGGLLVFNKHALMKTSQVELFMITYMLMFILLLTRSKKLLFTIIGGGTNLRRFLCTVIVINILFIAIYHVNNTSDKLASGAILAFHSIITFLMNEPPLFEEAVKGNWGNWGGMALILLHILLSLIYLGVFIAAIYRWLTRR